MKFELERISLICRLCNDAISTLYGILSRSGRMIMHCELERTEVIPIVALSFICRD
jgi:hypothetical protein